MALPAWVLCAQATHSLSLSFIDTGSTTLAESLQTHASEGGCQAGLGHPHIPTRDHPVDPGDLTPKPASPDLPLAPAGAALPTFPGRVLRTRTWNGREAGSYRLPGVTLPKAPTSEMISI